MSRFLNQAQHAAMRALRLRKDLNLSLDGPVNVIDTIRRVGVQIWFVALPTLEGLYIPGSIPRILIGALRPPGRRNFTGAHELGHHLYGHGHRVDEVRDADREGPRPAEEHIADRFADSLLMPKLAVVSAFVRRGWNAHDPSPYEVYLVSTELGVGYGNLCRYMSNTLFLISADQEKRLRRVQPKTIKSSIGFDTSIENVIFIDREWSATTVDVEVGDVIVAEGVVEASRCLENLRLTDGRMALRARSPGVVDFAAPRVKGRIRVARRGYAGVAEYRFLEEEDDEDHSADAA